MNRHGAANNPRNSNNPINTAVASHSRSIRHNVPKVTPVAIGAPAGERMRGVAVLGAGEVPAGAGAVGGGDVAIGMDMEAVLAGGEPLDVAADADVALVARAGLHPHGLVAHVALDVVAGRAAHDADQARLREAGGLVVRVVPRGGGERRGVGGGEGEREQGEEDLETHGGGWMVAVAVEMVGWGLMGMGVGMRAECAARVV